MTDREEKEMIFTWYSHSLAEIQSDAQRMTQLGFGKKALREGYAKGIDRNCESLRSYLYDLLVKERE